MNRAADDRRHAGLINVSQAMHRALKEKDIAHLWHVDAHGHDRECWAENLYDFAQRLFC